MRRVLSRHASWTTAHTTWSARSTGRVTCQASAGDILDAILCAAPSGEVVAESMTRGVRSQGSYSRSRIAVHAGFTNPSTSERRTSARRRCSSSSEQITSTSTSSAPATLDVPTQPSRVSAVGLTHSTITFNPSSSCSRASACATAYPTGPSGWDSADQATIACSMRSTRR